MKRVWLACAILLCVSGAAGADPLYRIAGRGGPPAPRTFVANAVESHAIDLDARALARDPARVTLALPGGRTVDVERTQYAVHEPGLASWSGIVPSFDPAREHASYVRFSLRPGGVTGVIVLPDGERFEVQPEGKGHALLRIGPTASAGPSCGMSPDDTHAAHAAAPSTLAPARTTLAGTTAARRAATIPTLEPPAPELTASPLPTTIDVLGVYPARYLTTEPESVVRAFAQDSIIDANAIFANSGVNAQYVLRYLGPLTGDQPPLSGIRNDLRWMNTTSSAELELLRNAYGADMVVLFVPLNDHLGDPCGIANLPLGATSSGCSCLGVPSTSAFGDRAYSVVRAGCGRTDFTVAHELGHNYGMWHDDLRTDLVAPYAHGYVVQAGVTATAMACTGFTTGQNIVNGVCHRIPYFSDPDLVVNNQTIGVPNVRDNARVAAEKVGGYAGFRPTRTTGVPTVRITSPARNASFVRNTNVTFTATASDPDQPAIASQIHWRVDGVHVMHVGTTFTTSFATTGPHTVSALVTDNTGVSAEWSVPVTITLPPPTTGFYWITPAEVAGFGAPGTLTVAGYATNGTGGVQLRWRDATANGPWVTEAYQPVPDGNGTWYHSIPAPVNKCHLYQAQSFYGSASSTVFSWNGAASGYCTETARIIWIQPQPLAGFGPASHLIVAGEARNAPPGYGVRLSYRNVTLNGAWTTLSYAPEPDMNGIWYNAIPASSYLHQYDVRVTYDVITTPTCRYAGNNAATWC